MKPSRLCLGTAQLGMDYGINNPKGKPAIEEAKSIIRTAINNGINAFDTAPGYGNAEQIIGECLNGMDTEEIVLVSKLPPIDWKKSPLEIMTRAKRALCETLDKLGIESLPIYLFHRFEDIEKNNRLLINMLLSLKSQGVIGKIGASIYTPEEAELALNSEGIEVIQVPFNMVDKRLLENGFFQRAKAKKVIVFCRSVFLQGLFFRRDIPENLKEFKPFRQRLADICADEMMSMSELALRFALSIDGIDSVIVGVENRLQLVENLRMLNKGKLSDQAFQRICGLGSAPEKVINPSMWTK